MDSYGLPNDLIASMHPDALAVVPMGRSTLVLELPTKVDQDSEEFFEAEEAVKVGQHFTGWDDAIVLVYHDPAWMGGERTEENFLKHRAILHFQGSRNFAHVFYEAAECGDGGVWDEGMPRTETCIICRGSGKGNWRVPNMNLKVREEYGDDRANWPEEVYVYWCQYCFGTGTTPWRPDWHRTQEDIQEEVRKSELSWQDLEAENEATYEKILKRGKEE